MRQAGRKSILVRVETSPEDIHGMHAAEGIVTTRGGMTSHAAVVARGMGKPCVSGASAIRIDYAAQTMTVGGVTLKKGDILTIDGGSGEVMQGAAAMVKPEMTGDFATLMSWADAVRRMKVRANAETPADARVARSFGAEGIGLCRTEHMFFDGERIVAVREMILADTEQGRRAALAKLLPMQRQDFAELFEIMTGLPVTIRLLDPPLHEFLPKTDEEIDEVAKAMKVSADKLRARSAELHEVQPDARLPRRSACDPLSRNRRDAGARHLRGRGSGGAQDRQAGDGGNHGARWSSAAPSSTWSRRSSSRRPRRSRRRPASRCPIRSAR